MSVETREYGHCPACDYSAPPKKLRTERKHFDSHALRCTRCAYTTETKPNWEQAASAWNQVLSPIVRLVAEDGQAILLKDAGWCEPIDTAEMTAREAVLHIFRNRRCHAVAPNGYTCPYLSVEEWSKIADWAEGPHP